MATLQEKLTEAESAYHKLVTGAAARVFVDQNGERIEYIAPNASRLAAYIADLKRQLGTVTPAPIRGWIA